MQPDITYISLKRARVEVDYAFDYKGVQLEVPFGYNDFDGCTGGIWAALLGIGRFGKQNSASLPHDYVYVRKGNIANLQIPRREIDKWAYKALREVGYNKVQCSIAYVMIRVVGYWYWREV